MAKTSSRDIRFDDTSCKPFCVAALDEEKEEECGRAEFNYCWKCSDRGELVMA